MLKKERKKLKDTDPFTILDYIKTSIEILMNMKMEESNENNNDKKQKNPPAAAHNEVSDNESITSSEN